MYFKTHAHTPILKKTTYSNHKENAIFSIDNTILTKTTCLEQKSIGDNYKDLHLSKLNLFKKYLKQTKNKLLISQKTDYLLKSMGISIKDFEKIHPVEPQISPNLLMLHNYKIASLEEAIKLNIKIQREEWLNFKSSFGLKAEFILFENADTLFIKSIKSTEKPLEIIDILKNQDLSPHLLDIILAIQNNFSQEIINKLISVSDIDKTNNFSNINYVSVSLANHHYIRALHLWNDRVGIYTNLETFNIIDYFNIPTESKIALSIKVIDLATSSR